MAEKEHLIVTAVGPDRVGLVESISRFISARNCNIEDSKMAVFCGEFAVIVLVSGDAPDLENIARNTPELESITGLNLAVKRPVSRKTPEFALPYRLTASCMDHPGVVYQISGALSHFGVNIESMQTRTYSAPVSGTPLFKMEANLSVPAQTNINNLRDRLSQIQREQNIDIDLMSA